MEVLAPFAPCLAVMMILGFMYGLIWLIDPKGAKALTRRWVEDWRDVLADEQERKSGTRPKGE